MKVYYKKFWPLKTFSLDITKELSGKTVEAVLHIEQSTSVRHDLTLKSPRVLSALSVSVRDLFNNPTTKSVDSLKVFGEQHSPGLRDSDMQWRIELWENNTIKGPAVHCFAIEGLPKEGWKTQTFTN